MAKALVMISLDLPAEAEGNPLFDALDTLPRPLPHQDADLMVAIDTEGHPRATELIAEFWRESDGRARR